MSTAPANTAIIIIDPYNDFLHPSGKMNHMLASSLAATNSITHLQTLVKYAHTNQIPIFYALHQQVRPGFIAGWIHPTNTQQRQKEELIFEKGSWGVEIYSGLEPDIEKGDVIVSKHWCSSSFANTDLEYQLRQRGMQNLIMGGMTANTCLESTARYAYEMGFNVTLLKDATAGFSIEQKDAATDLIWPLFARVLTVDEWIESVEKA